MRFLKLRTEIEKQVRLNLHDPNDYDTVVGAMRAELAKAK